MKSFNSTKFLAVLLLFSMQYISGQSLVRYRMEEIAVINSTIDSLVDVNGNKLSADKNSNRSKILYFSPQLSSDWGRSSLSQGYYKSNKYIERLKNNYLHSYTVDTVRIERNHRFCLNFAKTNKRKEYDGTKDLGTFMMSRVSFNKSYTVGYFFYRIYCGEDCGWEGLVKVRKANGKWTVDNFLCLWVS